MDKSVLWCREALEAHQNNNLSKAEELYKKIIAKKPKFKDIAIVYNNLGAIYYNRGQIDEGITLYKQAIVHDKNYYDAWNNLEKAYRKQGSYPADEKENILAAFIYRFEQYPHDGLNCKKIAELYMEQQKYAQAVHFYQKAIAINPQDYGLYNDLGIVYLQTSAFSLALECFQDALRINPQFTDAYCNLGTLHQMQGNLDQALQYYLKALAMDRNLAEVYNNIGAIYKKQGKHDLARKNFEQALQLKPEYVDALNNLGAFAYEQRKYDLTQHCLERLFSVNPDDPYVLAQLGMVRYMQGNIEEAIEYLEKSIQINSEQYNALNLLGIIMRCVGCHDKAYEYIEKAIQYSPSLPDAYNTKGLLLLDGGHAKEAIESFATAIGKANVSSEQVIMFHNYLFAHNYLIDADEKHIFEIHKNFGNMFSKEVNRSYRNSLSLHRKLRIGYVSSDLREHSVAHFVLPVLECYDRNRFEVFCYANVAHPDQTTAFIRERVDHWRDIYTMVNHEVIDLIRADQIDILIDLSGHTSENRLLLFAEKPAPIQISWIGYPHTTGLATIDYRFTDEQADPSGHTEEYYTETLIRLPNCFLCYAPATGAPDVQQPPSEKKGYITFGTFNNYAKINSKTIQIWAKILKSVPGSKLVIKAAGLTQEQLKENILKQFTAEGINSDALILLGKDPGFTAHMERYNQVDIALDTFPYNGTTTTCEALWMGVPVVTLANGYRHRSLVGKSLLTTIGCLELIAANEEEYIAIAVRLAHNKEYLSAFRNSIRDRMDASPLLDAQSFTQDVESAFEKMWVKWYKEQTDQPVSASGNVQNKIKLVQTNKKDSLAIDKKDPANSLDRDELLRKISNFPFWYHKIPLPGGIVTPGWAPLDPAAYGIPQDLNGMRVLDVGAWDGYWTFEALRRGAKQVVAIDDFSDYLGSLKESDRKAWETFDLCKAALGYSDEQCQRIDMSVYDASEQLLGRFDIVFFFGTLYHLRHPLLALDKLSAICDQEIYVETAILDDYSPYQGGLGHGYAGNQVVAEFYSRNQYGNNDTNWWVPTIPCLIQLVEAAGFTQVVGWKLTDHPQNLPQCRGFAKGIKAKR